MSLSISITVDSIDRSDVITFDSVKKIDALNSEVDTLQFSVLYPNSQNWVPSVNSEVILTVDGTKEFSGIISDVATDINGHSVSRHNVTCKDYSILLDRLLVTERYENMSVQEIIISMLNKYASPFSVVDNVYDTVLARWTLDSANVTTLERGLSASNLSVAGVLSLGVYGSSQPYPQNPVLFVRPPAGAVDAASAKTLNSFFAVRVTADENRHMNITKLTFQVARGGVSTPRGWDLRCSLDGFTTSIAASLVETVRTEFTDVEIELTDPMFSRVTNVTFRFYFYTPDVGAGLDVDNVTLYGDSVYSLIEGHSLTPSVITFDAVPISQCLSSLASRYNYVWYVDYDKQVHFLKKNDTEAAFAITDTANNHIFDSLTISTDFTQLRNRLKIVGGEIVSNERTETHSGTGDKEEFALTYKYSEKPTVLVDSVEMSVGLDNVNEDGQYDVMWSFQEKYLRFTDGHIPSSGTDNIEVTGIPLLPLNVIVSDSESINQYGVYEYKKEETRLTTKEDAIAYGLAELEAYKNPLVEGSFETYKPGLRSGQTISITSSLLGISDSYMIDKVEMSFASRSTALYTVTFGSSKLLTFNMILQSLLINDNSEISNIAGLFTLQQLTDTPVTITDSISTPTATTGPYYYATATVFGNEGVWNKSVWSG
jgi:hypothetical protein